MKKQDMQNRYKKYMQHAAWISAGLLLVCLIQETGAGAGVKNSNTFVGKGKQEITDNVVRTMLPVLVYAAEKDQTDTPAKDLARAVMQLWPAGTYMT